MAGYETILVACISGLLSVISVILTNLSSNRKIEHKLETAQEVTNTKIEHLTIEVRKHNSFAERIPVVETQLRDCERRLNKLEVR